MGVGQVLVLVLGGGLLIALGAGLYFGGRADGRWEQYQRDLAARPTPTPKHEPSPAADTGKAAKERLEDIINSAESELQRLEREIGL
jgi:hypothetical protein